MRAPMALRSTGVRVALIAAAAALACGSAAGQTSSAQARGIIATQNTVSAGTCSDTSACVEINVVDKGSVTVTVGGVYTGALTGQVSADGTTWITLAPTPFTPAGAQSTPVATISSGSTGSWQVGVAGWAKFRVTGLGAMTGAAVVVLQSSTVSTGGTGGAGGGASTLASGAVASGAYAAGALAAGSGVDGWDSTQGAKTDAACAGDSTSGCSVESRLIRIAQDLTTVDGHITASNAQLPTALGQTTKAASLSVAIASDQMTATANADANRLPVSMDIASPVTGTAASAVVLSNMPFAVGKGTKSVIVNLTANTATANFEWSTDGVVAYASGQCWLKTNSGNAGSVTTSTSASTYVCPVEGTHFQVRQSGAGGVTATVAPSAREVQQAMAVNVGGGSITAAGAAAVGATASGNPLPLAVVGRTAAPTVVTTGQVQQLWGNLSGVPVVLPFTIPELTVQATSGTTALTTNTSTQAFAAPSAGLRNYVTSCEFYNTHATVSTTFSLLDGNAGTAFFTSYLPAITAALPLVPAVVKFPVPLRQPTTATRMDVSAGTTGANVYWNCQGYAAP